MFKRYLYIFLSGIFSIILLFSSLFDSSNYLVSGPLSFPIHSYYTISSEFGYRNLDSYHFHNGIDIPAVSGTLVYPISYGTVTNIGFSNSYGNYVIISYTNGYKSLYGHISSEIFVSCGDYVSPCAAICTVGPKYLSSGKLNGFTTGPHLHFTLYKEGSLIDPQTVSFDFV